MAKKEETYNEAIEKLRKIVAEIENGDLDVDILSEKVKEATRLIPNLFCRSHPCRNTQDDLCRICSTSR